jgi:hypothetical protein
MSKREVQVCTVSCDCPMRDLCDSVPDWDSIDTSTDFGDGLWDNDDCEFV